VKNFFFFALRTTVGQIHYKWIFPFCLSMCILSAQTGGKIQSWLFPHWHVSKTSRKPVSKTWESQFFFTLFSLTGNYFWARRSLLTCSSKPVLNPNSSTTENNIKKRLEKMHTTSSHKGNANQNCTKIPPHSC
jgi:hypothetical protein